MVYCLLFIWPEMMQDRATPLSRPHKRSRWGLHRQLHAS